jgi:hypothetical protein
MKALVYRLVSIGKRIILTTMPCVNQYCRKAMKKRMCKLALCFLQLLSCLNVWHVLNRQRILHKMHDLHS